MHLLRSGRPSGWRTWYVCAALVTIGAVIADPAGAVVLNDAAATQAGGIENYYDSGNAYPNVVLLMSQSGQGICTGTLINARTVLTAAHCVYDEDDQRLTLGQGAGIGFSPLGLLADPNNRAVSGVLANGGYGRDNTHDIALISLAEPVGGIAPVTLAQPGMPIPAPGSLVRVVGYGAYGTGSAPPIVNVGPADDKRRAGETSLGAYASVALYWPQSQGQMVYYAQFRNPDSPANPDSFGLSAAGVPVRALEAGVAQGDSGGPLFLVTPSGLIEIGEVCCGYNPVPGMQDQGYGDVNTWTPVALFAEWIAANNPLRAETANAGDWNWSNQAAWPDGVPNNVDGGFTGYGVLGRYYQVTLQNPGTITLDIDPEIDSLTIAGAESALDIPSPRTLDVLGSTQLSAGTLTVNGMLDTAALNIMGGMLTGGGRIVAPFGVANTGGVIAPGSATALGTLTIQGDYVQSGAGALAVRLSSGGSDRLAVTGTAQLGGTLAVGSFATAPLPGQSFQVLSANAVTGAFDTVAWTLPAALGLTTAQSADGVTVTTTHNSYAGFAPDADAAGLGRALDQALAHSTQSALLSAEQRMLIGALPQPETLPDDLAALDTLTAPALAQALDTATPSGITTETAFGLQASRLVSGALTGRLDDLRNGIGGLDMASFSSVTLRAEGKEDAALGGSAVRVRALPPGMGAFLTGDVIVGTGGATNSFTTSGVTVGMDYKFSPVLIAGIALSYVNDWHTGENAFSLNGQSLVPSLYASWNPGRFYADGYVGYGFNQMDSSRPVIVGNQAMTAKASPSGGQVMTGVTAGLRFNAGPVQYGPFAALDYTHIDIGGYAEDGAGGFAMGIGARSLDSTRGTLGMQAAWPMQTGFGMLAPRIRASMTQEFQGQSDRATVHLIAAPDLPFGVSGIPGTRTYGSLGLAVNAQFSRSFSGSVGYQTDIGGSGVLDNQFAAKLRLTF